MDRFKITCNGKVLNGTKIFAPDGTDVTDHVRSIEFRSRAGELPVVFLEIVKPIVDLELSEKGVTVDYVDGELIDEGNGIVESTTLADEYRRHEPAQLNG